MEVTINQLMEMTGKSFRSIKAKIGKLNPVNEDGRAAYYESKDALSAIYTHNSELAKENLLLERARREKAEIEVKQLRGELLPINMVAMTLSRQMTNFRTQIRTLPSKMAKPLAIISDPHEVHSRLAEAIDEYLSELTADATYQLEADRIESSRRAVVEDSGDGLQAESKVESGAVGGPVPIFEPGE